MRVRPLSSTGDYTVGLPYLTNSPAAVRQKIQTRLLLLFGEWFANNQDGTRYVLGKVGGRDYNAQIQQRILGTPGVSSILSYNAILSTRQLTVSGTVQSIYSTTPVPFSVAVPAV